MKRGNYHSVEAEWLAWEQPDPASPKRLLPSLREDEAIEAVFRILRRAKCRFRRERLVAVQGRNSTGNYGHGGLMVNAGEGWREIVHGLSHRAFRIKHPDLPPHSWRHARLEAKLVRYVVNSGFLDGSLRARFEAREARSIAKARAKDAERSAAKTDPAVRLEKVRESIERWTSKQERARRKLIKLRASERGLVRSLAARQQPESAS